MYPALPREEKVAQTDTVLQLRDPITAADGRRISEIHVKKGQVIYIPTLAVQRADIPWGDGDVFRPTRWLVGHPEADKYCSPSEQGVSVPAELSKAWAGMLAFSFGKHECIGMRMALFEYKVLLLILVKNFVWEETSADIAVRYGTTVRTRVVGKEDEGALLPVKITHAVQF